MCINLHLENSFYRMSKFKEITPEQFSKMYIQKKMNWRWGNQNQKYFINPFIKCVSVTVVSIEIDNIYKYDREHLNIIIYVKISAM